MVDTNTGSYDKYIIGKSLIESAIKLDDALVDLLKANIKTLKRNTKGDFNLDELQYSNKLLKEIAFLLFMTNEKINMGISILKEKE